MASKLRLKQYAYHLLAKGFYPDTTVIDREAKLEKVPLDQEAIGLVYHHMSDIRGELARKAVGWKELIP